MSAVAGVTLARRRRRVAVALLVGPALAVVVGALVLPGLSLFVQSFLKSQAYGLVEGSFTLENYASALADPTYHKLALSSFGVGALAAVVCVALGYPVAFHISFRMRRGRDLALFLVVASLFSSYLVRLYAWYTILGSNGVINSALRRFGVIEEPLAFLLFSRWAVLVAFVNIFLPYAILMLTSAMQNIPPDLLENARDLGASPARTFSAVVLPMTMTAAVGSAAYTFILASGDYITPALLGGTRGTGLATAIANQFLALGDRPGGAALSFLMLGVFLATYLGLSRLERFRGI
jgi:spermidine/putrescine transport system permease protein